MNLHWGLIKSVLAGGQDGLGSRSPHLGRIGGCERWELDDYLNEPVPSFCRQSVERPDLPKITRS